MKIAILAKLTKKISPLTHSGTEAFTYELTQHLVKRGHDVTLYASSDSQTDAKLVSVVDTETAKKVVGEDNMARVYTMLLARDLAQDSDTYDIIHNNLVHYYFLLPFVPFIKTPILHTIHNAFFQDPDWTQAINAFGASKREQKAFVSKSAQAFARSTQNSSVIYNGIDTDMYAFQKSASDYVLWLSRMSPDKGVEEVLAVAEKTKKPFILNTVLSTQKEKAYKESLKSRIKDNVTLKQEYLQESKINLYQNAKAFLFPIMWEEPFGLVMLEAMSCGAPVIAYAKGSVPEIIEDGKTGFIVNSSDDDIRGDFIIKQTGVAGLCEAVNKIYALSDTEYQVMRQAARLRVEKKFTITKMIDSYEDLYTEMIKSNT
ncbi:MAG: glycosyltransferase family 4 protein [Candidatus Levybacteria bacterium]|nr:glycosyltransferase family 4 protein [Candidatus Levybacteria bacterium]